MFDSAKLAHKLDKTQFKTIEPDLRERLLNAQFQLIDQKRRSLLVLIHGADGSGKGAVLNRLYSWLDAHKLRTLTFEDGTHEVNAHPPMWNYWRQLPVFSEIAVVLGSWYHRPIFDRAVGRRGKAEFQTALQAIRRFEEMLHAENVDVLKLWLYIDPCEAHRRLKALQNGDSRRPVVREWAGLGTPKDRQKLEFIAEEITRVTSTDHAPWHMVPATDANYRDITVGSLLLQRLVAMTATPSQATAAKPTPANPTAPNPSAPTPAATAPAVATDSPGNPTQVPPALPAFSLLSTLDYTQRLDPDDYERQLDREQTRITALTSSKAFQSSGMMIAFEGSDAAGKSSTIMRLRQAMDPRRFRVYPIAAPTDEERARPYLWRFWRHVPERGRTAIFDRSWYGRVLVERVEGFAAPQDWARAYGEINDFEAQITDAGYVLLKVWLAITQEEQARRFEARETTPYKRFKLTPEDWRNREKWPLYEAAVTEMVDRTSTRAAPWVLVEAEDKRFARVKVARAVADHLEARLG